MKLPQLKRLGDFSDETTTEVVKSLSQGVKDSIVKDLGKDSIDTLWAQVLGSEQNKNHSHGEMHEGEEIDLTKAHKEVTQHIEAAYDYKEEVLKGAEELNVHQNKETQVKIQELLIELKKVIESSKELQVQFKQVTVEQAPAKGGKYHLNFVEWMLQNVRDIRLRIEDSGAWLAAMKGKKDKKGYWNMFKKHGTTFGLSNERSIATNVG